MELLNKAGTALNPIVTKLRSLALPPLPFTVERATALSLGNPLIPIVLLSSSRGVLSHEYLKLQNLLSQK